MAEPLKTNQQIDQLIKECMAYKSLIDTITPVEKEQIDWRLLYWAKIVEHKYAAPKIEDLKAKISQLKADSDYGRASAMEGLIEVYESDILTGRSVQQIYHDQDIFEYIQNYSKILEFDNGRHYTLKETLNAIDDLFGFGSNKNNEAGKLAMKPNDEQYRIQIAIEKTASRKKQGNRDNVENCKRFLNDYLQFKKSHPAIDTVSKRIEELIKFDDQKYGVGIDSLKKYVKDYEENLRD